MDRNLSSHCMVCSGRNDNTSHNYVGFHIHRNCYDKIAGLDMAQFASSTVITYRDRTIDDRWYVITDENKMSHYTVTVYASTQEYLDHKPCDVVHRAFYVSAVAYIVAQFASVEIGG